MAQGFIESSRDKNLLSYTLSIKIRLNYYASIINRVSWLNLSSVHSNSNSLITDITLKQICLKTEKALSLQFDFDRFYDQILNKALFFVFYK
jgi:hypothetical protein